MSHPLSLETIAELFKKARVEAQLGHAPTPDHGMPGKEWCPYCGGWWRKWPGSKLDGHAACIVPQWFKDNLSREMRSRADLRYADVAAAIGVSTSVVRSWVCQRR